MKRLANSFTARIGMAGAIASAMLFAFPAFAQDSRLSLADRVTRWSSRHRTRTSPASAWSTRCSNCRRRCSNCRVRSRNCSISCRQLDDKNKAQYIDLDARLGRLEGGGAGAAAPAATAAGAAPAMRPALRLPATAAARQPRNPRRRPACRCTPAIRAAAQAAYDVAFKAIRAGDYVEASREFRSFIQQYPNHALAPNAWYWLGESYYATTNYPVALESFQQSAQPVSAERQGTRRVAQGRLQPARVEAGRRSQGHADQGHQPSIRAPRPPAWRRNACSACSTQSAQLRSIGRDERA